MTTIVFKDDIHLAKNSFINLQDFTQYLEKNMYITELLPLPEDEITEDIRKKYEESKKLDDSYFVNI